MWGCLFFLAAAAAVTESAGAGAARLACYVEGAATDLHECTHIVYAGGARGDKLDSLLKEYRKYNPRAKIVLRVAEVDKNLRTLLKSKHVQGLELHDVHKTLNRTKALETVEAARSALTSSGGGPLFLTLPAHPELLAKYYDLRVLMKKVDLMVVETHDLGAMKKTTYHPSRLSGLWDMMNTDSVVDLVVGLGVPASKIVITLPASAQQFQLQNETLSTPGSPTLDDPKEIGQAELCRLLQKGRWTLERDQDLSAPYAFKGKTWISFEDASSVDVKGKYARVRGLAGLALYRAERDEDTPCGPTLRTSLAKVLNQQSRAPRAAVLRSLEQEILSAPRHARALDALQVSPYRITQVVDSDGVIHSIREDTRTEFSCSRQGYFVHPRSCARFYRCVKFDQLSPEYTVFEFDCPAGLAFDSRYEVCVWPGSLPHSQACPGSSEIAPVPRTRFICPEHEGYYADPENCRWFFACLDHGKAPLTAYEFRCPFGLGFDAERLKCDWPWLVPACGNIARYEAEAHGYSAATLTGAAGFYGQTADAVNVAGHQSLASGAALDNLVGIQGRFLTQQDALDSNFIASQELANGNYQAGLLNQGSLGYSQGALDLSQGSGLVQVDASQTGNIGLVQPTNYNDEKKYTSGSLILDDYRLPTKKTHGALNGNAQGVAQGSVLSPLSFNVYSTGQADSTGYFGQTAEGYKGYTTSSFSGNLGQKSVYQSSSDADNSGAYVHDPSGDYAEPYRHDGSPVVPYIHDSSSYKASSDYYDYNRYKGGDYDGKYVDNSGQYVQDNSGTYVDNSAGYKDTSGAFVDSSAGYKTTSGAYVDSSVGYKATSGAYVDSSAGYKATSGAYDASAGYKATSNAYITDYSGNFGSNNNYKGTSQSDSEGTYVEDNSGQYVEDNSGAYVESSAGYKGSNGYRADYSGSYKQDNSGQYEGVYRADGHIGGTAKASGGNVQSYSQANAGNYISDSKAYTGSSHTLTAGAINVGLVGKTTLVDDSYADQGRYQGQTGYTQGVSHILHPGHVAFVSQPAVSINHVGTDENNLDGYGYVTTPTSSGIPTTATPFAVTTALPAITTYKTTFVPEAPKSTIKQIFGYSQPAVTYVQPTVVAVKQQFVTPQIQVSNNQGLTYQFESKDYSSGRYNGQQSSSLNGQVVKSQSSGYDYSKPSVKFEDGVSYTTEAPVVSTYKPQEFAHSQQTLHKIESAGFDYSTAVPVTEEPFRKAFAYTTTPSVTSYAQPTVSTYSPQAFSHQTIHKVESSNVELGDSGYSGVSYEAPKTVVQYTTVQPSLAVQPVVSTYQPQVFSQQTLHKVDANRVNTYSQDSGYNYEKPAVKFEESAKTAFTYSTQAPTVVQYSTPAPAVVSTYRPQAYSHQTLHKFESKPFVTVPSTPIPEVQYEYQSTPITVYQNPLLKYTQPKVTPVAYVQPTYKPQAYSQQTIHKVENGKAYSSGDIGYQFSKSAAYEQPQTVIQYTTPQPISISTYQPQVYSQQTLHKVDASQVNNYEAESGYHYLKPQVKFEEAPKTVFRYSTPAPVVSTYKPQAYSQQTIHKVETQKFVPVSSTVSPKVDLTYQTDGVSTYENPIIKYTQKVTPVTYVKPTATVFTQTYQPIVQQHEDSHVQTGHYEGSQQSYDQSFQLNQEGYSYNQPQSSEQSLQLNQEGYSYNQPEIQRNVETARKAYSDASLVSHQTFHLANVQSEPHLDKDVVFVTTTPATLAYEKHYSEEAPNLEYKAPEYIPPKNEYQQSFSVVSSAAPVIQESYIQAQEQYVKPVEYSQQYENVQNTAQQVAFSTSHVSQPKRVESYHISSFPGTKITTKYQQPTYDNPEVQVGYKSEEYLPPVVSTPVVTTTYRPRTYSTTTREYLSPTTASTTREYLPPAEPEYNAPEYLPPSSTYRPRVKTTTPTFKYTESTTAYKASEYLPPAEQVNVLNFESFGFDNIEATAAPKIRYNPYQETRQEVTAKSVYRKPNIVVETAKSNLLGFGTVGPDAGLVSPISYTTAAPVVSSTYTYRPFVKSTSQAPVYVESTSYKAPEYLPPSDEAEINIESYGAKSAKSSRGRYQENIVSTSAPVQRKQNIVVQTAKANQFTYNSGPDAGLVSQTYTASTPVIVSSSESYTVAPQRVTSTYVPEEQGIFEVSPSPAPRRRVKPKVAVVTKINDFNPLLVRKLGAVCSCQSPILVLKGKRPNVPVPQDFDDYTNEYDDSSRGDVSDDEWAQKSARILTPTVTTTPIVTSTFNPIIVPDDSYYQEYQPSNYEVAVTPKSQVVVSSTPAVTSTQRLVRIRPRIKTVTVAPTYKTVLLNQEVAPSGETDEANHDAAVSALDSQSFDRYGPGGWRSRDETLQGSVDCKRAGLFRHPKQCNKFYACRWDCTKQRFTLHVFNCPVQLSFDPSLGACNWPSQGPACQGDTLLINAL